MKNSRFSRGLACALGAVALSAAAFTAQAQPAPSMPVHAGAIVKLPTGGRSSALTP